MYLKSAVLCFIVIVDFVLFTASLDANGEGVCVVKHSTRQKRKKTYNAVIDKWCGTRKCIARKVKFETYLTWTNHTVCCSGWQYDSDDDICSPICTMECHGGRCIGPEQCHCDPPAFLQNNTCVTPTCSPTCVNADCENNTCVCKQNFEQYNSTHCFHCDPGYLPDEHLNCNPICDRTCINGVCSSPNTCTCNPGYKLKSSFTCEPKCDCVNGECIAPNVCNCFKGFERINETNCAAKCEDCDNGDCVSPGNCSCHSGYVKVGGLCRPVCVIPCLHGTCTAPGVCSCDDGFVHISGRGCVKKCDKNCKGYCESGVCVPWDCRAPINLSDTAGKYVDRESLVCCPGWVYNTRTESCEPDCDEPCINGECVAPDKCECKKGYKQISDYECIPICNPECTHGHCASPNNCTCDEGYVSTKKGCEPSCDQPCSNGWCSSPNNCTCNDGYTGTANKYICEAKCQKKCIHGRCSKPDECECELGYEKDPKNRYNCVPKCEKPCKNGKCTKPNECTCAVGYEKVNPEDKHNCEPICKGCSNGTCKAPNVCTCNDGYIRTTKGCEPACSSCLNGWCSAPDTCTCNDGYQKLNSSVCSKPCKEPCKNGTCNLEGLCIVVYCDDCDGSCPDVDGDCHCTNGSRCIRNEVEGPPAEVVAEKQAGLPFFVIVPAVVGLLLFVVITIVFQRLWRRRNIDRSKTMDPTNGYGNGSVMAGTYPSLLLHKPMGISMKQDETIDEDEELNEIPSSDTLLRQQTRT